MQATRDLGPAFDHVATTFDDILDQNPIISWMHEVSMRTLRATFASGDRLLELGCGTGTAAIELARRGCTVFGFDISEGMVAEARRKVHAAGLDDRVLIVKGQSERLPEILRKSPVKVFDGGYANFTLTYVPDLRHLACTLAEALRPGASFVCTLPNQVVLSELVLYAPQLRFRRILSRLVDPLPKDIRGTFVDTHAYSASEVRRAFAGSFEIVSMRGIPFLVPPSYLHAQFRRLGNGQRLLLSLDERLAGRYPWNRLGEHTLFVFRRRRASRFRDP